MQIVNSYVKILEHWVQAAEKYFYTPANNNDILCYGTGESYHWAVQANMNAFAALAVLATAPDLNEHIIGMKRHELLELSLKMLRYSLLTHHSGSELCSNNGQWGHSWISVLALERMMHGFDALDEFLTVADRAAMRKILESESNNILDNCEIVAGIETNNKPEANIWNGAMLLRTATYYPDTSRRDEYGAKAVKLLINGISIPSDRESEQLIAGKMVKEWHVGANFTKNYSLNHHGYMNVGYMVICLSNIAMLHFSFKIRNMALPDVVYFHAQELWRTIKKFTCSDGRLLRIGGDTRVRYCYCQDYAIPMWLFVLDKYGDNDVLQYEAGWLEQVDREMTVNTDGSFLSARLWKMAKLSPYYYTRLEGDRAVTISYGAYWRRYFSSLPLPEPASQTHLNCQWQDEFHGATMSRNTKRIAAWVWSAGQGPSGLCLPPDASDMAEWQNNLSGELVTTGEPMVTVIDNYHTMFDNGFINFGQLHLAEKSPVGEGEAEADFARQGIVFVALPDGQTVISMQYAETLRRINLRQVKGLGLKIPNDLFNKFTRKYSSAVGELELLGCPGHEEFIKLKSSWLNIDNIMSVFKIYGAENFTIYRPVKRQIKVKYSPELTSLYADEICSSFSVDDNLVPPGEVVIDTASILMTSINAATTKIIAEQPRWQSVDMGVGIRALTISDINRQQYLLIANFSQIAKNINLLPYTTQYCLLNLTAPGNVLPEQQLKPFTAQLFKLSEGK